MTPERIEELRNKIGLSPDEACEVLDRIGELEGWIKSSNRAGHLATAFEVIDRVKTERDDLRAEIENLLNSAVPHPDHHPTMFAAWKRAKALLSTL